MSDLYSNMYLYMNFLKYYIFLVNRLIIVEGIYISKISMFVIDRFMKKKFIWFCMCLKLNIMVMMKMLLKNFIMKVRE